MRRLKKKNLSDLASELNIVYTELESIVEINPHNDKLMADFLEVVEQLELLGDEYR